MNTIGQVYWITGLSGAGKTTLARALQNKLPESVLPKSIILDGDALREVLAVPSSHFDRASRLSLAYTYARLCKLLADQGAVVIIATISLFHEVHEWNKENLPNYMEIFLDVSEGIRKQRDPKLLYAKEQTGDVQNMAGSEVVIDFPKNPHLTFKDTVPIDDMIKQILARK